MLISMQGEGVEWREKREGVCSNFLFLQQFFARSRFEASTALFSATHGFVRQTVTAVRPIAFVAPKAGLLSRVSMWEHLQLRLADLDVCLLSRVRCGNACETKGGKNNTQAAL